MAFTVSEKDGAITFDVRVVPRASRERLGPVHGEHLKIHLMAPPVEGAANDALVDLVARELGCRRGDVAILRGATARTKTLRVAGATRDALLRRIEDE